MKPPYLNKLTKKQLKKEYTRQWREAIRANGEIYKGNITNEQLHEVIRQQEQEIHVKSIALTEHFWKIQDLNFLLDHERKERTRVELQAVDLEEALSSSRQLRKSLQELADRKHGEKAKIEDMARNLYEFVRKDFADSLEKLLDKNFFSINPTIHSSLDGSRVTRDNIIDLFDTYDEITEEKKDFYRANATHIISHLPTDDKQDWQPLDEGKAG